MLAYLARQGMLQAVPPRSHGGRAGWLARLGAQRQRLPGSRLFLDDLVEGASAAAGLGAVAYPWPDARAAAAALFSRGGAGAGALAAKQALLAYYLLDAGGRRQGRRCSG